MIRLVRDRDLNDNKPLLIVYTSNKGRGKGFVIKLDLGYCTVRPYVYHGDEFMYGERFRVRYRDIHRFIQDNDKEGLFRYLMNIMEEENTILFKK